MKHSQALLQSNLDIVLLILSACNLGTQIKDIYSFVEEKFKFLVNYVKSSKHSRNFCYEALKTQNISSALPMNPARVVHLDPKMRLTVSSCVHQLHWQLALTCTGSLSKVVF